MSDAYDSRPDTHEHIAQVRGLVLGVAADLTDRAHRHDRSKLEPPEVEVFDRVTPLLKDSTYGSDEYKDFLADMGEGLRHHYAVNDHHPEHFPAGAVHEVDVWMAGQDAYGQELTKATCLNPDCDWSKESVNDGDLRDDAACHESDNYRPGGVHEMNLIQLTEMLCDWIAATRRHADGDIHRSIDQNADRFDYGEELRDLLHRSVDGILAAEIPTQHRV